MIVDKQNVKAKSMEKDVPKCDENEAADSEERSFGSLNYVPVMTLTHRDIFIKCDALWVTISGLMCVFLCRGGRVCGVCGLLITGNMRKNPQHVLFHMIQSVDGSVYLYVR